MKTLVLGDIHGRTCWKDIIEKECPDLTIFLGDYVSTHEKDITSEQQINNLKDILDYKENYTDSVILLRGNHDVQHLVGDVSTCSFDIRVCKWMKENKGRFMEDTQWVYEDGDIVFSHAGISKVWYKNHEYDSISQINEDTCLINFEFTPCKMSDYCGETVTQPLTWIRPSALIECGIPDKTYVVGHTQIKLGICEYGELLRKSFPEDAEYIPTNIKVWCCDALPKQYLIIQDGEFKICNNI